MVAKQASQAVLAWQAAGQHFNFAGRRIFYRDEGEGETLLLIHGFPTASWDWWRVWPELTQRYRVIAPDMLGFGFSAKPKKHHYTLHEQADLHEALMAQLNIKSGLLLVHDYGVSVGQELLARQNAGSAVYQARAIAFLNGGLFPEKHHAKLIQKILLSPFGPLLSHALGYKQFSRSFSSVFGAETQPNEQELSDFWHLIQRDDGNLLFHKLIRYMADRREHRDRWVAALHEASIPLRLINGPVDPVSGQHLVDYYREQIPSADTVSLPGIGHYPQVEDPEGVLKAFLSFAEHA